MDVAKYQVLYNFVVIFDTYAYFLQGLELRNALANEVYGFFLNETRVNISIKGRNATFF